MLVILVQNLIILELKWIILAGNILYCSNNLYILSMYIEAENQCIIDIINGYRNKKIKNDLIIWWEIFK